MAGFTRGLELGELFYHEAVRPILERRFPGLEHSAALIGWGSEVLGFDTAESTDHEWGPRVMLFLAAEDWAALGEAVGQALSEELPPRFRGYSTHFAEPDGDGVRVRQDVTAGPVRHLIFVGDVGAFLEMWLGFDPRAGMTVADWLTTPEQRLLEITAGRVYHDGLGELGAVRAALAYYPRDVWLYLMLAGWRRIDDWSDFVGRSGESGDAIGASVLGALIVRDLMRLAFLLERRYAPYAKWLGTAFARLELAATLGPALERVLAARDWRERSAAIEAAFAIVGERHNALGITPSVPIAVKRRYERPYEVVDAPRFVAAIKRTIVDPAVLALGDELGKIDQWSDSAALLTEPGQYRRLRGLFEVAGGA